uniref:Uncharacterized protein n=1 Tax=Anopheles christyi TaxID=43041 RepID=A0A182KIM7_9DIPT
MSVIQASGSMKNILLHIGVSFSDDRLLCSLLIELRRIFSANSFIPPTQATVADDPVAMVICVPSVAFSPSVSCGFLTASSPAPSSSSSSSVASGSRPTFAGDWAWVADLGLCSSKLLRDATTRLHLRHR